MIAVRRNLLLVTLSNYRRRKIICTRLLVTTIGEQETAIITCQKRFYLDLKS